ncbi:hypothetical protein ACWCSD_38895 [Nonomuraea sp. NPDC001684]
MSGIVLGRGRVMVAPLGTDPRDEDAFTEIGWGEARVFTEDGLEALHDSPGCPDCGEQEIRGRIRVLGKMPYTVFECGHVAEMVPFWLLSFRDVQAVRARRRTDAFYTVHLHMFALRVGVRRGRMPLPADALEPTFGPGWTNLHGPLADVRPRTMRSLPA